MKPICVRRDVQRFQQRAQPGFDRLGRIGRRGRHLEVPQRAVGGVVQSEVGERAADVEADAIHAATVRAAGAALKSPLHHQPLPGRQFEHGQTAFPHEFISSELLRRIAIPAVVVEHDHSAGSDPIEQHFERTAFRLALFMSTCRNAMLRGATSASTSGTLPRVTSTFGQARTARARARTAPARGLAVGGPHPRRRTDRTGRRESTVVRQTGEIAQHDRHRVALVGATFDKVARDAPGSSPPPSTACACARRWRVRLPRPLCRHRRDKARVGEEAAGVREGDQVVGQEPCAVRIARVAGAGDQRVQRIHHAGWLVRPQNTWRDAQPVGSMPAPAASPDQRAQLGAPTAASGRPGGPASRPAASTRRAARHPRWLPCLPARRSPPDRSSGRADRSPDLHGTSDVCRFGGRLKRSVSMPYFRATRRISRDGLVVEAGSRLAPRPIRSRTLRMLSDDVGIILEEDLLGHHQCGSHRQLQVGAVEEEYSAILGRSSGFSA